jgi:hypothetical protein
MICVSQVTAKDNVTENTTITLKTDRQIPRPFFAFLFDGPVLDGTAELADGHGAFGYLRARAEKLPNPENSFVFRLNSINFATSTWFPGDGAIKITVPSKGPVHLIRTLAGAGDDPDATFQVNLAYGCG